MSDLRLLAQVGALIDARAYDDGLRLVGRYLMANPADVEGLCLAARAEIGRDNPARAYELAARAAALAPESEWPLRLVSISLVMQGEFDAAVAAAEQAVRIAPQHWQTHYQLAAASYRGPGGAASAQESIDEALRMAPDQPSVHRLAGSVQAATRRTAAARASFTRALALDPQDAIARHELARLSLRRGNLIGAARGFGDAVALDPSLDVGVRNIDVVVAQLLRTVVIAIFAASLLFSDSDEPRALRLSVVAGLTLAIAGALGWFWHRTGTRLAGYLRSLPTRQPLSIGVAALSAVALVCLWIAAGQRSGPVAAHWADASHVGSLAAFVLLIVWLRRRGNLHFRFGPRRR